MYTSVFFLFLVFSIAVTEPRRCDRVQDCTSFGSFCHGPFVCNATAYCTAKEPFHDPCREIRLLYERTVAPEYTISFLCIEEIRACVEVYYCVTDHDCDCTKQEQCLEGECRPCDNQTQACLECDPVLLLLREKEAAAATLANDSPTTIYVVTGGVILFLFMGACVTLCTIYIKIRRKSDSFY